MFGSEIGDDHMQAATIRKHRVDKGSIGQRRRHAVRNLGGPAGCAKHRDRTSTRPTGRSNRGPHHPTTTPNRPTVTAGPNCWRWSALSASWPTIRGSRIATAPAESGTHSPSTTRGKTVNSTDGGYEVSYGRNRALRCVCGTCRDYSTGRRPRRYVPEGYTGRAPRAVPGAHFPDHIKPWK
jgi:hypothetical protein